ncbi:hypothetical protein [Iningainema tapete]|nr:hypothetical protein [Iningainema tapete]
MTRFDPTGGYKDPEEWSKIAFRKTTDDGLQFKIIGGLVVAGMAAAAVNPVTGLLVAVWTVWNSFSKVKEIGRSQAAIRDYGCVAHMLDDNEFRDYVRQVRAEQGEEALQEELRFAVENGLEISDTALDYLEINQSKNMKTDSYTLQNNIYVPKTLTQSSDHKVDNSINIIDCITNRIGNLILIGTPGSGKGMLLANAIRAAKSKHPDLKIFVIDPKADPQESGYFDGAADVVKRFPCERAHPEDVADWLEKCFNEYYEYHAVHKRVLLILDEGTLAGSKAKEAKSSVVKNTVLSLASAGDSQGKNIWITSLSPFIGDLGINLNASSQLTAIAILKDVGVLKQWSRASVIEKAEAPQLQALIDESPCQRAVYYGGTGKWYAMPTLHNYSAFDRDNRKPAGDALSSRERQSLRAATAVKGQSDLMIEKLGATKMRSLTQFITEELGITDNTKAVAVQEGILKLLRDSSRKDLLKKFGLDGT